MSKLRSWVGMGAAKNAVHVSTPRTLKNSPPEKPAKWFGDQVTKPDARSLLGAATSNFDDHSLGLRTETLIRLCYYAFEENRRTVMVTLEKQLRCGIGGRQRHFQHLVCSFPAQLNLRKSVQPYMASVNGNIGTLRHFFGDFCDLAVKCNTFDARSVHRMKEVGRALGLDADHMSQAIHRLK